MAILTSADIIYDHVGISAYDDPGPISNGGCTTGQAAVCAEPLTITLTFNEPIEHFALADITVSSGTLANLVDVTSGVDFTEARADFYFELAGKGFHPNPSYHLNPHPTHRLLARHSAVVRTV